MREAADLLERGHRRVTVAEHKFLAMMPNTMRAAEVDDEHNVIARVGGKHPACSPVLRTARPTRHERETGKCLQAEIDLEAIILQRLDVVAHQRPAEEFAKDRGARGRRYARERETHRVGRDWRRSGRGGQARRRPDHFATSKEAGYS